VKGPHQRLSDATTKVAAKSADSATERTSAGRSSCINAKRQPAANIMSTQSTNMPTRHGRWLPPPRQRKPTPPMPITSNAQAAPPSPTTSGVPPNRHVNRATQLLRFD